MISWITTMPVWELIRISGIVTFLLLFAGITLGILYSFPIWKAKGKKRVFQLHKLCTNIGTVLALLHSILPIISPFMPFTWKEVLIPFTAHDHRILNGLGTIASYGLLFVIFMTDIKNVLGKKLWYVSHLLAYPMFILVWIHGFFIGTDTDILGIRWMYVLSATTIVGLTLIRMMMVPESSKKQSPRQLSGRGV